MVFTKFKGGNPICGTELVRMRRNTHFFSSRRTALMFHYFCNKTFTEFLAKEFMPWVRRNERFAAILRRFVQQKTNQTTSWQDFQRAIEAGAGQDVHWFFEQWFERTGAPDYQLTWKQEGRTVRGLISQPAPYFRATLEVEVNGSS